MENSRGISRSVQKTTDEFNQSTTGANSCVRLLDELQLSSSLDEGHETNVVDEHHHHESMDVERFDNSSPSELQLNNPIADDLNEYCLSEIFSHLSLNDIMQVRRVCKKWYQVSDQWYKQVQTLVYMMESDGQIKFELYEKYYGHKIHEGTEAKKLIPFLHSYGHRIKYYKARIFPKEDNLYEGCAKYIIQSIPKLCKNIVDIEIWGNVNHYTSWDCKVMAIQWKKLKKIHLGNLPQSVEENIIKLLRGNKQLTIFKLYIDYDSECIKYDNFFTYFPVTMKEIVIENLSDHRIVPWSYFISASKNFTSLQFLKLMSLPILTDDLATAIANIQSLTHLALKEVFNYESNRTINLIAKLKDLKTLDLSYNSELDDDNLIYIVKNCIQLESLSICKSFGIPLTDRGLAALANLKKLKCLDINMTHVTIDSIINSCESLELFVCFKSSMNDTDAINFLNKATNLRFVVFESCENLTKDVLDASNEIANKRKTNILCITGCIGMNHPGEIITPYFKYFPMIICNIPMEIFPDYIKDFFKNKFRSP